MKKFSASALNSITYYYSELSIWIKLDWIDEKYGHPSLVLSRVSWSSLFLYWLRKTRHRTARATRRNHHTPRQTRRRRQQCLHYSVVRTGVSTSWQWLIECWYLSRICDKKDPKKSNFFWGAPLYVACACARLGRLAGLSRVASLGWLKAGLA